MVRVGQAPCCRVRELLGNKLTALDEKIAELDQFRGDLDRFMQSAADLPDQADTTESFCPLLEIAPTMPARAGAPSRKCSRKLRGQ